MVVEKNGESEPGPREIPEKDRKLIHRLSRIQGQLEAVKKTLEIGGEKDCQATMQLIKAANHAMKKFGEAYVAGHLEECMSGNTSPQDIEKEIRNIVSSVFNM